MRTGAVMRSNTVVLTVSRCVYLRVSTFVHTVGERSSQRIVAIKHAPRGLKHRVEQTVAGRAVPQRVETTAESLCDLGTPVNDRLLHF